jgi:multiple sugar transport system substrate-binding protein
MAVRLSRRHFVRLGATFLGVAGLAACQPKVVEKIVKETVVVEKSVEKVVKETVMVAGTPVVVEKVVTTVPPTPASKAPVTLRFPHAFSGPSRDVVEANIAGYMATHPNVTIQIETLPYGDFQNKLLAMAAANTLPDVSFTVNTWQQRFIQAGVALNLKPWIDLHPEYEYQDFTAPTQKVMEDPKTGDPYGVVYNANCGSIFYNADLFQKMGVTPPPADGNWTYDDMREMAKKMTVKEGNRTVQYGLYKTLAGSFWIESTLRAYKTAVLADDSATVTINSPESIKAHQYWLDLIKDGSRPGAADYAESAAAVTSNMWYTGTAAMIQGEDNDISASRTYCKFNWDLVPMPKGDKKGIAMSSGGFFVVKTTKYPEAAWDFFADFTGKAAYANIARISGWMPPRKSNHPSYLNPSLPPKNLVSRLTDVPNTQIVSTFFTIKSLEIFNQAWYPFLGLLNSKTDLDVQKGLDDVAQQIKDILKS